MSMSYIPNASLFVGLTLVCPQFICLIQLSLVFPITPCTLAFNHVIWFRSYPCTHDNLHRASTYSCAQATSLEQLNQIIRWPTSWEDVSIIGHWQPHCHGYMLTALSPLVLDNLTCNCRQCVTSLVWISLILWLYYSILCAVLSGGWGTRHSH